MRDGRLKTIKGVDKKDYFHAEDTLSVVLAFLEKLPYRAAS